MKYYKQARKYAAVVAAGASTMLLSASVHAASLLPAGTLDTVGTNAKDTALEIVLWAVGIIAVLQTTWFIATGTKKGMGKAGIK